MNETIHPGSPEQPPPRAGKLALKATDVLLEGAAALLLPGVGGASYKLTRSLVHHAVAAREENCKDAGGAFEAELGRDVDGERRAQEVLDRASTNAEDKAKLTTCMRLFRESGYHPDATVRKALGICAARILKEVTDGDLAVEASDALAQLTALDLELLGYLWEWSVKGIAAETTMDGSLLPMSCNPGMGSGSFKALLAAARLSQPKVAEERVASSKLRIERLGLISSVTEGGTTGQPRAVQLGEHRLALAESYTPPIRTRLEITDVGSAVVRLTAAPSVLARGLEGHEDSEPPKPRKRKR